MYDNLFYDVLYNQTQPKPIGNQTEVEPGVVTNRLRPDMFVDPETFELTIGQVQVQDNGLLACKTVRRGGRTEYFDFRRISVYGKFNEGVGPTG